MSRWPSDAHGRLAAAALELFSERGYDQTSVAEIAARAGLTERTFFRYFADKREVLFGGSDQLQNLMTEALAAAPSTAPPLAAIAAALDAAAAALQERRDFARRRHAIIAAHQDLQERELIKLDTLAVALAHGLRQRKIPDPAASLTAQTGVAVFKVAFERWACGGSDDLRGLIHDSLADLTAITAAR